MLTWAGITLPRLHYPLPGAGRIAVLTTPVQCDGGVRSFPRWTCHQLMRANPDALAGPLADLLEVARLRDEGFLPGLNLTLPLLVLSTLRSGAMTPDGRQRLWDAFGLPFLEQIRDARGRLLAYECEARNGFHWVGGETFDGLPRPGNCPCALPVQSRKRASVRIGSAARVTTAP